MPHCAILLISLAGENIKLVIACQALLYVRIQTLEPIAPAYPPQEGNSMR